MMYNRLVRTDLMLVIVVISMLVVQSSGWKDVLPGFGAALCMFSVFGHIQQFRLYKKFY